MKFKIDKGTGYMYSYSPQHPCANGAGKVMEHVYVMSNHIGRMLMEDECVHHKDRNRQNNVIDNLQLMTQAEHTALHQREDRGSVVYKINCKLCNKIFETTKSVGKIYCTENCFRLDNRRFEVSKEDLQELVWKHPSTHIGKMFGVSDKAIEKRCKLLGIEKPPRGYWAKKKAGKI